MTSMVSFVFWNLRSDGNFVGFDQPVSNSARRVVYSLSDKHLASEGLKLRSAFIVMSPCLADASVRKEIPRCYFSQPFGELFEILFDFLEFGEGELLFSCFFFDLRQHCVGTLGKFVIFLRAIDARLSDECIGFADI